VQEDIENIATTVDEITRLLATVVVNKDSLEEKITSDATTYAALTVAAASALAAADSAKSENETNATLRESCTQRYQQSLTNLQTALTRVQTALTDSQSENVLLRTALTQAETVRPQAETVRPQAETDRARAALSSLEDDNGRLQTALSSLETDNGRLQTALTQADMDRVQSNVHAGFLRQQLEAERTESDMTHIDANKSLFEQAERLARATAGSDPSAEFGDVLQSVFQLALHLQMHGRKSTPQSLMEVSHLLRTLTFRQDRELPSPELFVFEPFDSIMEKLVFIFFGNDMHTTRDAYWIMMSKDAQFAKDRMRAGWHLDIDQLQQILDAAIRLGDYAEWQIMKGLSKKELTFMIPAHLV